MWAAGRDLNSQITRQATDRPRGTSGQRLQYQLWGSGSGQDQLNSYHSLTTEESLCVGWEPTLGLHPPFQEVREGGR